MRRVAAEQRRERAPVERGRASESRELARRSTGDRRRRIEREGAARYDASWKRESERENGGKKQVLRASSRAKE